MDEREAPEAGDEWTTKALLLGATVEPDVNALCVMWRAYIPPDGKWYFGMTPARAGRKLVRSIVGDVI